MNTIVKIALGTTIGLVATSLITTFVVTRKGVMEWIVDKSLSVTTELIDDE